MTLTPGKVVLSNPLTCTNTAKGDNKLYSDAKGVVPSLDLRFAEGKTLNDYMTGQQLIQFSRPVGANQSPGTYVDENGIIQLSSANTPRFDHDPTTGESLGLLVEESRTNLLRYSEQLDNALWGKSGGSLVPNVETSPAGDQTADKFVPNTTNSFHYPKTPAPLGSSGLTYTYSVFVKQSGYRYLLINTPSGTTAGNSGPIIDLQDGVVVVNYTSAYPTTVVNAGNGWWRVAFTFTGNGSPITLDHNPFPTTSVTTYAGDGTSGVLLWGAQLEEGSFPTSYIPTTGTALTRNADLASITGSNFSSWYNQSEGSFYYEGAARNNPLNGLRFVSGTHPRSFLNSGSAGNNNVGSYDGTYSVGLGEVDPGVGGIDWQDGAKAAVSWSSDTRTITKDGQVPYTAISNQHNIAETQVYLNRSSNGTSILSGTIARLTYFPDRLEDSVLQAITQ
jgi:hypothetical protein